MTVSSGVRSASYMGNGVTTNFTVPFEFFEIIALVNNIAKTLGTDYSVTGGNGNTGNVIFNAPPSTGASVMLYGNETISQSLDLVENNPFPADAIERAFDRLTMITGNLDVKLSTQDLAGQSALAAAAYAANAADAAAEAASSDGSAATYSAAASTSASNAASSATAAAASAAAAANAAAGNIIDTDGTLASNSDGKIASQKATKTYVDGKINNAYHFKGSWDASAGTFPGGGTAQVGDTYRCSVAGTVNGVHFDVNDSVTAIVANASTSTYASNWDKNESALSSAEVVSALGFTPPTNARQIATGTGLSGGGDLTADRTLSLALTKALVNAALGLNAAGGLTLLGTITTTSGATQAITGLGTNSFYILMFLGVSMTTNTGINVAFSSNNGASYSAQHPFVGSTTSGAQTLNAIVIVPAANDANAKSGFAISQNSGASTSSISYSQDTATTAAINAIQLIAGAGTFDAGAVLVYGMAA